MRSLSSNVLYGDQVQFPVYAPDPELLRARAIAYAASNQQTESHYNANLENRAKAAGAYNFSQDEKIRAEQMAGLKNERLETVEQRELGLLGKGKVLDQREKEKEDRKRKVMEKRKEMEAKRLRS